jgi:uncharacterized protein YjiS (DUF1127 family)
MTTSIVNIYASLRPARRSYRDAIKHYLIEWRIRSRSRFELSTMGDPELGDVGMTHSTARFEATKPFWRE